MTMTPWLAISYRRVDHPSSGYRSLTQCDRIGSRPRRGLELAPAEELGATGVAVRAEVHRRAVARLCDRDGAAGQGALPGLEEDVTDLPRYLRLRAPRPRGVHDGLPAVVDEQGWRVGAARTQPAGRPQVLLRTHVVRQPGHGDLTDEPVGERVLDVSLLRPELAAPQQLVAHQRLQ